MADHLILSSCRRAVVALGALLLVATASAEDLPDPTRPPAAVMAPAEVVAVEPPKPAGLQSVIISRSRSAAIIDGQTVELGGKYGDVRLIEVNDTGVILQGARGKRQVMTLFPGVSMSKKKAEAGP